MGSISAAGFAEQVDEGNISLAAALSWHLQSNHYPPVPSFFIGACKESIELGRDEEWDADVELPRGCAQHGVIWAAQDGVPEAHSECEITAAVTWKDDREVATASALIDSFHLHSFL